ncbi:HET domain-containing protein [Paramyrothecium foliicola]|nr:HET domain-containing protein [Paramyrothecium foliicola]
MRLLNCQTLLVEEFFGANIPPYVILSHTWEAEEVTYQDALDPAKARSMKGWDKITAACTLASLTNHNYIWIDTCCIDKKNPTELTEAINSMFTWYANASICYAWLSDYDASADESVSGLEKCRWFTRGWTLQELVAPAEVQFYDIRWCMFGTRTTLAQALAAATGIDKRVLAYNDAASRDIHSLLREIPVARRMSWAANRQTSRLEDISYSLLGIFDVNMPLLYGEGHRAFVRLQEEILKDANDLSLLAWLSTDTTVGNGETGVFATSPSDFQHAGGLKLDAELRYNPEFSMTNKGLRITTTLEQPKAAGGSLVMWLSCHFDRDPSQTVGIYLEPLGGGVHVRVRSRELFLTERAQNLANSAPNQLYIAKHVHPAKVQAVAPVEITNRPRIRFEFALEKFEHVATYPAELWDGHNRLFHAAGLGSVTGFHQFRAKPPFQAELALAFGYDEGKDKQPWLCMVHPDKPIYQVAMSLNMSSLRALAQKSMKTSTRVQVNSFHWKHLSRTVSVEVKMEAKKSGSEKIYVVRATESFIFIS